MDSHETLDRAWLTEVSRRWQHINETSLASQLSLPTFALSDSATVLGSWTPATRTLAISRAHIADATWIEIDDTLRHEMAHQVVSELLAESDSRPHGPMFKKACEMLQIGASPRVQSGLDQRAKTVLRRVQKLLSLAQSDNPHESEAATAAANRLLLQYNLELDQSAPAGYSYRRIGPAIARVPAERKLLSAILQEHFFVRCIWLRTTRSKDNKPATVLEIMGTPANIEIAAYVHDALFRKVDDLWTSYRQSNSVTRSGRRSFRVGIMRGFRDRLDSQRVSHEETGLVWSGDPAIQAFYAKRYPRTSRMSASGYRNGAAHDAGRQEGRRLRIEPGVGSEKSSTGIRELTE